MAKFVGYVADGINSVSTGGGEESHAMVVVANNCIAPSTGVPAVEYIGSVSW